MSGASTDNSGTLEHMTFPSGWVVPTSSDSHLTEAIISACLEGSVDTFEHLYNTTASHLIPPASYLVRCAADSKQLPMLNYILRMYPLGRLRACKTKLDDLSWEDRLTNLDVATFSAIRRGDIVIVKRLLKAGMPLKPFVDTGDRYSPWTLLESATRADQVEVARLLLEHGAGAKCNSSHSSDPYFDCMAWVAAYGSNDMLQLLLEYGWTVESCDALWLMAGQGGSMENAQRWLDLGADINKICNPTMGVPNPGTALHAAAANVWCQDESTNFAKWLLQHGIDYTLENGKGQTALQVAEGKSHNQMKTLIEDWIRAHTKQQLSPRRLRSSKHCQSPLRQLETPRKGRTGKKLL